MSDGPTNHRARSAEPSPPSRSCPEFAHHHAKINQRLLEILAQPSRDTRVRESMTYSLLAPGKRLRPLLTLLVAEMLDSEQSGLEVACGIEMIHTASLMLDDLPSMDDANLRRGRPSNHRVFGEDATTLAAVALLNLAYERVVRCEELTAESRLRVMGVFTDIVGEDGLVGGQIRDLDGHLKALSQKDLKDLYQQKTGCLFVGAATVGALVANASESSMETVQDFARRLGLAFQIIDDILDRNECSSKSGKDVGQDARKSTLVRGMDSGSAKTLAKSLIADARAALLPFGRRGNSLMRLASSCLPDYIACDVSQAESA